MTYLARFTPRYASTSALFVPSWIDETPPEPGVFGLLHDLDAGNISPFTSVLADGETSEPTVYAVPRDKQVHWFFGLTGANGKRPIITVSNDLRQNAKTMEGGGWAPVYSYDQLTWHSFDSGFAALSTPTRVQFQHSAPFAADTVYIADHPVHRHQEAVSLAAQLNADTSGLVHVSSVADSAGVIGTTPAELDDLGRSVGGNLMWGFRLEDESLVTLDGGPRREIILTCGTHPGEIIDGWFLRGAIDWYLHGTGDNAERLRANFRLLVYFGITPNGRRGGEWRSNFERSGDPNRNWVAFTLYETQRVRDAIAADSSRVDIHIDFHSASNSFKPSRIFTMPEPSSEESARYLALKAAFDSVDAETLDLIAMPLSLSTSNTTGNGHTRTTYGAFSFVSEPGTRRSATVARYRDVGAHYLEALTIMDDAGEWYVDDGFSLIAGLRATATLTADLVTASAPALLEADLMAAGTMAADLMVTPGAALLAASLTASGTLAATLGSTTDPDTRSGWLYALLSFGPAARPLIGAVSTPTHAPVLHFGARARPTLALAPQSPLLTFTQ